MKIAILTTRTPFVQGGAEAHAANLRHALEAAGHLVELVEFPFNHASPGDVYRAMFLCETENMAVFDAGAADLVICLKFPAYAVRHPRKVVWLLHQFRPAYDLWDEAAANDVDAWLRAEVHAFDRRHLGGLGGRLFTNSPNVSTRLSRHLGIASTPLYHPPPILPLEERPPREPVIFCPSRIETLKRQTLLVEAMERVTAPVRAVIAGSGGQYAKLEAMVEARGLRGRVTLLGAVSDRVVAGHYARAAAVFYGPRDEDYGYVTLEAMLARCPVITCTDSGGPTSFVEDGVNGRVVAPDPAAIAEAIDALARDPAGAAAMGERAFETCLRLGLSWPRVVETLLDAGTGGR